MDWKLFTTVFGTMFLAELGDKTQLTVLTYTCSVKSPISVFLGGAAALVLSTLLAVLVGEGLVKIIPVKILHILAAIAFIIIGILLLIKNLKTVGN
jgi:putative Ca2+/H+ antiporter (TMEM165/GDT1 family)